MPCIREYPQMLLTTNYEEAIGFYKKCKMNMVGIISDMPLDVMEYWTNKPD